MTYSEKLKDPRWQKKRLQILERDNWTCQICEATDKTLHVHHWQYYRDTEPWDYDEWLLVTVCDDCHSSERDSNLCFHSFVDTILKRSCVGAYEMADLFRMLRFVSSGHGELVIRPVLGNKLPDLPGEWHECIPPPNPETPDRVVPRFRITSEFMSYDDVTTCHETKNNVTED